MGQADGFGVHSWVNGDRYQGEFKECLKHGLGTERFVNGDIYVGNYVRGKPQGYGQYYWINGNNYQGYFVNGLRHGKGIWQSHPDGGDIYEGQYRNDKKCGYGQYRWVCGNYFQGNFENDLRHNYGEMFWNDGRVYKGQWLNGIQVGEMMQTIQQGQGYQNLRNSRLPIMNNNSRGREDERQIAVRSSKHLVLPNNSQIHEKSRILSLPPLSNQNRTRNSKPRMISVHQSPKYGTIDAGNNYDQEDYGHGNSQMVPKFSRDYNTISYETPVKSHQPKNQNYDYSPEYYDFERQRSIQHYQHQNDGYGNSQILKRKESKKMPWRPAGIAKNFNPLGFEISMTQIISQGSLSPRHQHK